MNDILKSWKTSVAGSMIVVAALYVMVKQSTITADGMTLLAIGVGLIVSKDADVSGTKK